MWTGPAHLLLNLTAVAPVLVVYAASVATSDRDLALALAVAVVCLVVICALLLVGANRYGEKEPKVLESVTGMEKEPVAFLVAYGLPIMSASFKDTKEPAPMSGFYALLAFIAMMTALVWQQQVAYVNPLAAMLGFHFHSGKNDEGANVLVITRKKSIAKGQVSVVTLSTYLWLYPW